MCFPTLISRHVYSHDPPNNHEVRWLDSLNKKKKKKVYDTHDGEESSRCALVQRGLLTSSGMFSLSDADR